MGTRGKELSLYHALQHGLKTEHSSVIVENTPQKPTQSTMSEKITDHSDDSDDEYSDAAISEKQHLSPAFSASSISSDLEKQQQVFKESTSRLNSKTFILKLAFGLLMCLLLFFKGFLSHSQCFQNSLSALRNSSQNQFFSFPGLFPKKNESSFEITLPAKHSVPPVRVDNLMTHKFADTWGKPKVFHYEPWSAVEEYNFIELEMKTQIEGTQYDRLLHIFVENITVWRSSTVEPLNRKLTKSKSYKDITKYITLFKKNELVEFKFQLDNLVTARLDGVFDVELNIRYFNFPEGNQEQGVVETRKCHSKKDRNSMIKNALLHHVNPYSSPDHLEPVIANRRISPLMYFPHSQKQRPYSHPLNPFFNKLNETKMLSHIAVELFVNGNAAEEFWYTNVIDKYAGKFEQYGHSLLGHGPMRLLNVFLTNVSSARTFETSHEDKHKQTFLVHQSIPPPVIFTGGISPALWKPVVSIGAFDLKPIDIDLTPYLKTMLENPEQEWFLEFEIVSANGDTKYRDNVGNNWIISGNVMAWDALEHPANDIQYISDTKTFTANNFTVESKDGEDFLKQNVTSKSVLVHQHNIMFQDQHYNLTIHHINKLVSNQTYKDFADKQSTILNIVSEKMFVLSNSKGSVHINGGDKQQWALVVNVDTLDTDEELAALTYKASIVFDYSRKVFMDNTNEKSAILSAEQAGIKDKNLLYHVTASQVGNSEYTLSPKGNHGTGNGVHSVAVTRNWPWTESYKRSVIVKNNKAVIDVIKS
ncbi:hypothetical protein ACO0QE_001391 [Hanseniaspora vineae]